MRPCSTICKYILVFSLLLSGWIGATDRIPQNGSAVSVRDLLALAEGPDRNELPWKIEIQKPRLMYLQYYLVDIQILLHANSFKAQGGGDHLYFVTRLKDSDGRWINGHDQADMALKKDADSSQDISASMALYVRPGKYEVVIAGYESATRAVGVTRREIQVGQAKDDRLASLDSHLEPAAFPQTYPTISEPGKVLDGELFEIQPFASPLQITVPEATDIDIVASVSKVENPPEMMTIVRRRWGRRFSPDPPNPDSVYRLQLGRVLQSAYVLAQLRPSSGCVTLTIIDPLKRKVVFKTRDASKLDWNSVSKSIDATDQMKIDARDLADKKGAALFTQKFFDEFPQTPPSCEAKLPAKRRVIAVIGHAVAFPEYHGEHISPAAAESATFYHFFNNSGGFPGDQLRKVLKPADVRELSLSNPQNFRKSLARFVDDLAAGK